MKRQKRYEITYIDTGRTSIWTESKCIKTFGKYEWEEIKQGYAPHIVAIEVGHGNDF